MANAAHPDAELVARCLNGDDPAWRELVERYSAKVYRIAYHRTYDRAEAEELTQDCFLKVWENLDRYEPTEASLLAWIATLSRNLSIDHYRKRRREKGFRFVTDDALVTLLPGSDDPSADAVRRERLRFLLDALAQLPDELAEVVQMRDLDGLDYREIADLLGLPDGTVKSRLNRARVELARIVRERIGAAPLARGPLFGSLTPQPGGGACRGEQQIDREGFTLDDHVRRETPEVDELEKHLHPHLAETVEAAEEEHLEGERHRREREERNEPRGDDEPAEPRRHEPHP